MDLERSAIISTPPRARTAPAWGSAAGAGARKAEARGRSAEQRATAFMARMV